MRRFLGPRMALFIASIIAINIQSALGTGVFQLRLRSFDNDMGTDHEGRCCSGYRTASGRCSGSCRTKFRICLKHYQSNIDHTSPCTFGEYVTPVLGNNSFRFSADDDVPSLDSVPPKVLEFSLNVTWPGTFSLIMEAWHETNNSSASRAAIYKQEDVLVWRRAIQRYLDPGGSWSQEPQDRLVTPNLRFEYRFVCSKDYYGPKCDTLCKPRNDTFGHFTCSPEGKRICNRGWTGEYCTQAICKAGCHKDHGTCTEPFKCKCHHGWTGPLCDQCERYPGCKHGTCRNPWECNCEEGWGGMFCDQDLNYCTNHEPCRNGGTCFNTGQGSYTCTCPENFTGKDCEIELDHCSTKPCFNGGTCLDNGSNYTCACPRGWHGRHCETAATSCSDHPCQNDATCVNSEELAYTCLCRPGFEGSNCETKLDHCANNPCMNGGTCEDRVTSFKCICERFHEGDRCERNVTACSSTNLCMNGGTCPGPNRPCLCPVGFVGALCQTNVDDCANQPCAQGATCIDLVNDFKCECPAGMTGKDCSGDIDDCSPSPCRNGGICHDLVNGFNCVCPPGFTGPLCSFVDKRRTLVPDWHEESLRSEEPNEQLSGTQVAAIAAVSVAVPLLALCAAVAVCCMKQRRRKEQARADEEARRENEANARSNCSRESNLKALGGSGGPGSVGTSSSSHLHLSSMIVNNLNYPTSSKCVNSSLDNTMDSCVGTSSAAVHGRNSAMTVASGPSSGEPLHILPRTKSYSKQLNTDSALCRASVLSDKLEKDLDNMYAVCHRASTLNHGDSMISMDPSSVHCSTSESTLGCKSAGDSDYCQSPSPPSGSPCGMVQPSGSHGVGPAVYVIGKESYGRSPHNRTLRPVQQPHSSPHRHPSEYGDVLLATEV